MYTTKFQLTLSILFLMVAGLLFLPNANAETVHALLVIMDDDKTVGDGMKVNQEKVETLLAAVALDKSYYVDTTVYLSSRNQTRKNNVLNWISDIRPARDDVVFVYYGGHGGMVSNTDQRTFLQLTDGRFYRSELKGAVEGVSCRLKILITDACSNGPAPAGASVQSYKIQTVGRSHIRNLFDEHEGFLHATAATEGEFAWCHTTFGSFFTSSLMEVIASTSDTNRDGFVAWDEVLALAKADTQILFKQAYDAGSFKAADVQAIKDRGITSQTPKVYSFPQRKQSGSSRNRSPFEADLWELENPSARFDVDIRSDKSTYRLHEYVTFDITAREDCYIMVLNWDEEGTFTVLLPNEYQPDVVFLRAGQRYTFPSGKSDFDLELLGPAGIERFKVIAISAKAAMRPIENALNQLDGQRNAQSPFISQKIGPRGKEMRKRADTEQKIMDALKKLKGTDWSVMNGSIKVHN